MERLLGITRQTAVAIAIAMSCYHLYTGFFGSPEAMLHRALHLLFVLVLVFFPAFVRQERQERTKLLLDLVLLALVLLSLGHIFWNYRYVVTRLPYIQSLSRRDVVMGLIFILIVLEATRRQIGWALPITAVTFILYALLGRSLPGPLQHMGFGLPAIVDQLYLSPEGIFGIPLGVSASYVILFVIFGAFLEESNTGQFFMDFATALTGGARGGPGKISVVSSGLFGTISGSAVANVMVDGWLTIPLMKRTGFKKEMAAAIEATASTGGQIMPPVMGATAFVMAEYTGIPYIEICKHAAIPALLYYLALFMAIHFEATQTGLQGIPRDERPRLGWVMVRKGHLLIPLVVIVYLMIAGYTPTYACLVATVSVVPIALFRPDTRMGPKKILNALKEGARNMLPVGMACACAGIVIGMINLTGLGIKFTSLILHISGNSLLLALFFTMLAGIVLGMGMPTTAAYIVQAALLIPALIKLGASTIGAHLFVFYFACISAITPPVAMAVYAAAGISGSNVWRSGLAAMKIGATGFIVPFMFVFGPALLLVGSLADILMALVSATIGVILLSAGLIGWFLAKANYGERVMLVAAAFLLIKPGLYSDLAGIALMICVVLLQKFRLSRRAAITDALPPS